uniref:Uncharacterized protein n=1 Tax=Arundo donax TaxID=35708 RepID=A0A0A8ZY78_ARUDO
MSREVIWCRQSKDRLGS